MADFFASSFWTGFLWPLIVMVAQSVLLLVVLLIAIGATAVGVAHQVGPGGDSDACTSTTGDFTQQQLQDCFDSQNG